MLLYTPGTVFLLLRVLTAVNMDDGSEDLNSKPTGTPKGHPAPRTWVFICPGLSPIVLDMCIWAAEQGPWWQLQCELNSLPASTEQSRWLLPRAHKDSCQYPLGASTCSDPGLDPPSILSSNMKLASFTFIALSYFSPSSALSGAAFCFGEKNLLCWNWNTVT